MVDAPLVVVVVTPVLTAPPVGTLVVALVVVVVDGVVMGDCAAVPFPLPLPFTCAAAPFPLFGAATAAVAALDVALLVDLAVAEGAAACVTVVGSEGVLAGVCVVDALFAVCAGAAADADADEGRVEAGLVEDEVALRAGAPLPVAGALFAVAAAATAAVAEDVGRLLLPLALVPPLSAFPANELGVGGGGRLAGAWEPAPEPLVVLLLLLVVEVVAVRPLLALSDFLAAKGCSKNT